MEHIQEDEDRLKALIAKAVSAELTSREVDLIREMLPQLKVLLDERGRQQWLMKRIWAFLLAGPAMFGVWQVGTKIVEWIRGGP